MPFRDIFGAGFVYILVNFVMPWYNGDYPPSYKNQPPRLRNKAVEFANILISNGAPEGVAIASGLKKAREFFTPKIKRPHKRKST